MMEYGIALKLMEVLCNTAPWIFVSLNNRHKVLVSVIEKRVKYVTQFHSLHFEDPFLMMSSR